MKKTILAIAAALIAMTATGAFASSTNRPDPGKYHCSIEYKDSGNESVDIWNVSRLEFREMVMELKQAPSFYVCTGNAGVFRGEIEVIRDGVMARHEEDITESM